MAKQIDADGNEIVAPVGNEPAASVEPQVTTKPKADEPEKLTLTRAELDAQIAAGVAQAREAEAEQERIAQAEKDNNYKVLLEEARANELKANQTLWRTQALNKYKLSESLVTLLVGETKETIMASAKKLRESMDEEVKARLEAGNEETAPHDPGKTIPPKQQKANLDAQIGANMRKALGIGKIQLH